MKRRDPDLERKSPDIHPEAFVSEFAYVGGNVEVGAGSSVWPGTVIRGDTGKMAIGRNTCIQDGSIIRADDGGATIGDNVVIGHRVMCHAERVGDGAVLGNGAVVNGGSSEIGEHSIVASGAVVLDNAKVPARTFVVGIPAIAKDQVTDEQIAHVDCGRHHRRQRDGAPAARFWSKGGNVFTGFSISGRNDQSGDPQVNALIEKARVELDTEKRRALVFDLQGYLAKAMYGLNSPGVASSFLVARPCLGNFDVWQGALSLPLMGRRHEGPFKSA